MYCILSDCVEQFKLVIHNRWGEKVFESEDINQCWDGKFKGIAAQTGVYAYNVYLRQLDGTEINKIGAITLVR
jgi:gliding motility-associated-like protein